MEELKEKLNKLASRSCWNDHEDFIVYELAGGNIDDAYYGGYDDGQANLAREILAALQNIAH